MSALTHTQLDALATEVADMASDLSYLLSSLESLPSPLLHRIGKALSRCRDQLQIAEAEISDYGPVLPTA